MRRINQAYVNDRRSDVVEDLDHYLENKNQYSQDVCMHVGSYVLPIKNTFNGIQPGVYIGNYTGNQNPFLMITLPKETMEAKYSEDNIIDYKNASNINDIIKLQEKTNQLERECISQSENVYHPIINEKDSSLMIGLKLALGAKKIDLNKYSIRWSSPSNYNNDKRLLSKGEISLNKTIDFCNNTDIKATVIFEDASPNVINPMGKPVVVEITSKDNKALADLSNAYQKSMENNDNEEDIDYEV